MRDKEVWPPISPDSSHLDNFVLGVSELLVKAKPHNKTEDLILKIKEAMGSLDRDTVAKAYRRFRSISEAVVAADVYLIEYSYSQFVYLLMCFYYLLARFHVNLDSFLC